jgi:S-methylmethionine-dependent homocysteine/selenocysteine methylase
MAGVNMAQITLLDGGMGQELVARSGDAPTPLWATRVMIDHPGLVKEIHADYFAAGASVATTNTYNILHDRLEGVGLDGVYHALHLRALAEAHEAKAEAGRGMIAGSMGPLGESYRPDLTPPVEVSAPLYAEKARILAPHVDVILLETLSSLGLAEGALKGAQAAGRPVWLSVSVHDRDGSKLRSGEPVAGLADLVAQYPTAAVLANCSMPEAMLDALRELKKIGLPFGAYANGFSEISSLPLPETDDAPDYTHRHDLSPEKYTGFVMQWIDLGATIVGGCCEVGPTHIRHLASALRAAGHEIL